MALGDGTTTGANRCRVNVLVTGHRGNVGRWVADHLEAAGCTVGGFDLAGDRRHDLLDLAALHEATDGCDAVVHRCPTWTTKPVRQA